MTWQMLLASCAAQNLLPGLPASPDPAADTAVEWDASSLGSNLILSNFNRDVTNNGVNNSTGLVTAVKPIRPSDGIVYWEILIVALGAATNSFDLGVIAEYAKGATASNQVAFQFSGGAAIRDGASTASIQRAGITVASGLTNIRQAGLTINFALDAGSGKMWIGRNGVWYDGGFGAPTVAVDGVPTLLLQPGKVYWPCLRPSDNADQFRLQSIASHFAYPMPAGCKAYGSDLVNFIRHELPVYNNGFVAGPSSSVKYGWTIEAGGSTTWSTMSFNYGVQTGSLSSSVHSYFYFGGSGNRLVYYPTQSAANFGGIWQEHTFDIRFNDLIDSNQMILEMEMWLSRTSGSVGLTMGDTRMCAGFYDATDTLIGSLQLGDSKNMNVIGPAREQVFQYFNIPPLTRKIRLIWRIGKQSGNTTLRFAMSQPRAALLRKVPLVRASVGGDAHIVLGKAQNKIGIRSGLTYVILTPAPQILLMSFDGADGDTTTTDESQFAHAFTFVGNAQIDDAQSKFGGTSLRLGGAGDRIHTPNKNIWHFGLDAFTVEAQVMFNAGVTNQAFFGVWDNTLGRSWLFYIDAGSLKFRIYDGLTNRDTAVAWVPSTGVWYHIACDREANGTTRLYIDGVMVAKTTALYPIAQSSDVLAIGAVGNANASPAHDFNGWMDEIRILRGHAAWATDAGFSAPVAPY